MIEKDLIGKEDINFGTGTAQRRSQAGSTISITQVNASHIPVVDSADNFEGTTLETVLTELLTQNGAGSSAADYLNNSGSTRAVGDVVVVSTGATKAYTTTTTVGHASVLGVVQESTLAAASGKVVTGGYCPTVKVTNATSIGSFLRTSSTAGQAVSVTTAQQGVFGLALSSTAGAGTVSALLFGVLGQSYLPVAGGNLTGTLGLFKGTDVASASALNPWASSNVGNYFDVTGTNTITSIGTSGNVGTTLKLHFDAGLTLTHHATNLILPGAVDIVTTAGDELEFVEYASGQWRCSGYVDASTTGTGNVVRATSPTIAAPTVTGVDDHSGSLKVDVVNEHTSAAGVTVDGLLIKDNYPVAVNNTSGVKEGSVDWANAGGLTQFTLMSAVELTDTNGAFVDRRSFQIYVPVAANSLEYVCEVKVNSGANTGHYRLQLGATNGTDLTTNATTYTYTSAGTLDISAVSGWQTIDLQAYVTAGTWYLDAIHCRII